MVGKRWSCLPTLPGLKRFNKHGIYNTRVGTPVPTKSIGHKKTAQSVKIERF
jgi:hypothetical protein